MPIREIQERGQITLQEALANPQSGRIFAAGRYQIVPGTLNSLIESNIARPDDLFSPEIQDRLAIELLRRRNVVTLIEHGRLEEAQDQIAREWRAIDLSTGSTRDGTNRANPEATRAVQDSMRINDQARTQTCSVTAVQRAVASCPNFPLYVYVSDQEFTSFTQGQFVFVSAQSSPQQLRSLFT